MHTLHIYVVIEIPNKCVNKAYQKGVQVVGRTQCPVDANRKTIRVKYLQVRGRFRIDIYISNIKLLLYTY